LFTDDSLNYLSAAKSFRLTGRFLSPDGTYFVAWPPLFPVLLSFFDEPLLFLTFFNLALKIIIGVLLYLLSKQIINTRELRWIFLLVTGCGVHLTMISVFVWSELLFLTLLLASILIISQGHFGFWKWFIFVLLGCLLCLQRHVGVLFILPLSIFMLAKKEFGSLAKRAQISVVYILCSLSGTIVWLHYAMGVSKEFSFNAYHFFEDVLYNAELVFSQLGKLFLFGPEMIMILTSIVVLITSVLVVRCDIGSRRVMLLIVLMIGSYLTVIIFLGRHNKYDLDRLLSVIVPLVYLLIFSTMEKLQSRLPARTARIMLVVLLIWSSYPLLRTWQNVQFWHRESCLSVLHK
jgi:hypothetical protein